jgi:hypothetical protein
MLEDVGQGLLDDAIRIAVSIIDSVLITFTGLNLIANYALPGNPQAGAVQLAAAAPAPAPAPAPTPVR